MRELVTRAYQARRRRFIHKKTEKKCKPAYVLKLCERNLGTPRTTPVDADLNEWTRHFLVVRDYEATRAK